MLVWVRLGMSLCWMFDDGVVCEYDSNGSERDSVFGDCCMVSECTEIVEC